MLSPRVLVTAATLAAAVFGIAGCDPGGGAPSKTAVDFDRPVPASEPRAELPLEIDLEPASDCEERFDLALYRDRRVALIAWDDAEGCVRRAVVIRYLSAKLAKGELLSAVKELARAVRPGDASRDTSGTSSSSTEAGRNEAGRNEETK